MLQLGEQPNPRQGRRGALGGAQEQRDADVTQVSRARPAFRRRPCLATSIPNPSLLAAASGKTRSATRAPRRSRRRSRATRDSYRAGRSSNGPVAQSPANPKCLAAVWRRELERERTTELGSRRRDLVAKLWRVGTGVCPRLHQEELCAAASSRLASPFLATDMRAADL